MHNMNEWKTWEDRCLELLDGLDLRTREHDLLPDTFTTDPRIVELRELITSSPEENRMRMVKPR